MKAAHFFKSGGLIRVSKNLYVSIFSLLAVLLAFASDFSLYTALVFFSILVHEVAHIAFLKIFGAKTVRAVAYPFGIDMVCDTSRLSFAKEFVCVISGGAANLIASLAFWLLFCVYDAKWMIFLCVCNACIGFANLIPFSTFDGGRALSLLLNLFFLPDRVYVIQKYTDIAALCVLCAAGAVFLDFCGFNISLLASFAYCLASSAAFGLYKRRYI